MKTFPVFKVLHCIPIFTAVEDDKSTVNMAYDVGTFVGGSDILTDGELGGTTTVVTVCNNTWSFNYFHFVLRI